MYKERDYVPGSLEKGRGNPTLGGTNGFGTILLNDLIGIEFKMEDGTVGYNSPTSLFAHEIVHAIHSDESDKAYNDRRKNTKLLKGIVPEEDQTVCDTDIVNKKLGESQRGSYHKKTDTKKVDSPTSSNKSNKTPEKSVKIPNKKLKM